MDATINYSQPRNEESIGTVSGKILSIQDGYVKYKNSDGTFIIPLNKILRIR